MLYLTPFLVRPYEAARQPGAVMSSVLRGLTLQPFVR